MTDEEVERSMDQFPCIICSVPTMLHQAGEPMCIVCQGRCISCGAIGEEMVGGACTDLIACVMRSDLADHE